MKNKIISILLITVVCFHFGCEKKPKIETIENANEEDLIDINEWPSSWIEGSWPPKWPDGYISFREFSIQGSYSEGIVDGFLDLNESKVRFGPYNPSEYTLVVHVLIYDKKNDRTMNLCYLPHSLHSVEEGIVDFSIVVAPEEFGALSLSKRWKLFITSRAKSLEGKSRSGPYEVRHYIPRLSKKGGSVTIHFQKKSDPHGESDLSFADTEDFEIRIYSHLEKPI